MENASKALLIAGGIFLAMMILSLLVYVGVSMSDMAESQNRKVATEQIAQFNQTYLAYDKTKMYGIDVITVVNKAIDYNTRLGTDEEKYRINIILKLNQNFDRTKQIVTQYGDGRIEEEEPKKISDGTLKTGTYQLFERDGSMKINNEVVGFFHQKPDNKTTKTYGKTVVTTFEYSAITNFKTAIFKCESDKIEYSEDGRIKSMTFTQIKE